jgi:hypothetical protein
MTAASEIRRIVASLRSALGRSELAGLPNLGSRQVVFNAARVRGEATGRLAWPLNPHEETEALVLLPSGALAVAICKTGKTGAMVPRVDCREVADDELRASDVTDLWRTLVIALSKHLVKTGGGNGALRQLLQEAIEVIDPTAAESCATVGEDGVCGVHAHGR